MSATNAGRTSPHEEEYGTMPEMKMRRANAPTGRVDRNWTKSGEKAP